MLSEIVIYRNYNHNGHEVVAGFSDEQNVESAVYVDGRLIDSLPKDYVCDFHIHNDDLYIIYNRAIRRVPNISGDTPSPDEGYTLEMQDYYSYENPKMLTDNDLTLWAHIGGRLFRRDGDGWTEVAAFPIGETAEVTDDGLLKFSKNLLRDDVTEGCRIFNPKTGQLIET
ncbi:MAG: hypothetical protein II852_03855 [Bacteroidales bacterium]|nr:hypothetical protein [Bacteroidales bacterium]